ncbi:MAG: hypothetical protein Q4D14_05175 [Bacteroidales bacterium]|nr:hypothetical protein [Bacteroidales bacterium]
MLRYPSRFEEDEMSQEQIDALGHFQQMLPTNKTPLTRRQLSTTKTLLYSLELGDYNQLMSYFPNLKLTEKNATLTVEKYKEHGLGSTSQLIVEQPEQKTHELSIQQDIIIDNTTASIWQIYMLHNLWRLLPLFWHANYSAREYLFSKQTWEKIAKEINENCGNFTNDDLCPYILNNGNTFYITACFWSDFDGLVRDICAIKTKGNRIEQILDVDERVMHKYWCGILF